MIRVVKPALAALVLHLVLIQPNHPGAMTWAALRLFPLELPVLLLGLALIGDGRAGRVLRAVLAVTLTAMSVLKIADVAMFTAFSRGFNPVGDWPLAMAGVTLLTGTVGPVLAWLAVGGLIVALVAVAGALWWAMAVWARVALFAASIWLRRAAGAVALGAATLGAVETVSILTRWDRPFNPPGAAFTARLAVERVVQLRRTLADIRSFRTAAAADPFRAQTGLLDRINRDVVVIFVESYGRASVDGPLYADTTRPVLAGAEAVLAAKGVAMRSGYLLSPTRGGQSWLAHSTFASGLRINDQVRYQALLASGRDHLFHIAQRSGFATGAAMPAISMAWPEGAQMGFDRIFPAADLGYRGRPFNWVTMPDQFTLAAFDRLLRDAPRQDHLFAQVVLISSHAPWVPVPRMVAWDDLGDGTVFDAMAQAGDPPDVVWRDPDRVRDQYRQAVAYAVQAVFGWADRAATDPGRMPLVFVLGDHQAARFVAQDDRADVPIHVLGPPDLVARVADWGFAPGLIPPDGQGAIPMESMRDLIVGSFSTDAKATP